MIRRYFAARHLNAFIREADALKYELPLSSDMVAHAETAITGLHKTLLERNEPTYTKPDYPFNAWALAETPYGVQGQIFGIAAISYVGSRSFYLSDRRPGELLRVLSVPHPSIAAESQIVRVSRSTVPDALHESPSLYTGLMNAVDELIDACVPGYELPQPPIEFDGHLK